VIFSSSCLPGSPAFLGASEWGIFFRVCVWRLRRFPSFVWGGIQRKLTSAWLVVEIMHWQNETRASCHSRRGVM